MVSSAAGNWQRVARATQRIATPLVIRDYRLVWAGQAVSALGGPLQMIGLTWLVLNMTGSAVALSGTLLAAALPAAALKLVGGVMTDRFDPRTVMLWSDACRAVVTGVIAVLAWTGTLPLWLLDVLVAVSGLAAGVFAPAAQSIIPRIVPKEHLEAANALSQGTPQIALLVAAPAGGALIALVGPAPALALNAASYGVAVVAALAMAPLGKADLTNTRISVWQHARAGWIYMCGQHWLRALLLLDSAVSFAGVGLIAIGLPLLARDRPQSGVAGFGLMLAGFGAGSVIGMVIAGGHAPQHRRGVAFCLLQLGQAPLVAGLTFAPLGPAVALLALTGLINGISNVMYMTLVQGRVAAAMLGRGMSFVALGSFGLAPFSQVAAGVVGERVGPATLFLAAGVLMGAAALSGVFSPSLRHLD